MATSATTPLTPAETRAAKMATLRNRIITLVIVILLGGLTFFFNWRVHQLSSQIRKEESRIKELSNEVGNQADIINRFKDSVSNSDVIKRVDGLEENLNETEARLNAKLENAQQQISDLLSETMKQLDITVADAKKEIYSEVDHVKSDVDVYVAKTQDQFSMENSFMIYQIAGTFTLISGLISMWHMTAHIRRFRQPFVQRKILAILWMSPIYSVTSWLGLVFPTLEGYLEIIKDFYEAYIIYQFLAFLIAVLGKGDRGAVVDLLAKHADHLTPPFRLCGCCRKKEYDTPKAMADEVLLQCQVFTMQFVLFRPLTTIALFALKETNYWGGGTPGNSYDWRSPQLYIIIVQNVSVFVAFSGLLKFYHAVQDDLSWCRPFPKFLCIKGIVFMTFWQGLVISILARTTRGDEDDEKRDQWAQQAQSFLICLEMLLFSLGHFYCFPTEEWEEGYRPAHEKKTKFGDNIALGDFLDDLKLVMGSGRRHKSKRKKSGKLSRTPSVSTVGDDDDAEVGSANIEEGNLLEENGLGSDEEDDDGELDLNDIESDHDLPKSVRDAASRVKNTLKEASERSSQREEDEEMAKEESEEYAGKPNYSSMDDFEDSVPSETTSLIQRSRPKPKDSKDDALRPSIFTTFGKMDEDTTL